ncbi:TolC family protein [Sphingomonas sp.]|uniref:TolC family protein n=1 Tax=Sphingomonas sp. TaxID=28214 RepID=UPI0025D9DFB3|nr:TolC family protein [Sphingomonas sp.]
MTRRSNRTATLALRSGCTALLLAIAGTARAEPITFDQAIELASHFSPGIKARATQVDAERLKASTANQLPDPKLQLGVQDYPVTGPNAFDPLADDFTMLRVGVSQDFPNPAKRRARVGRAQADIAAAEAGVGVEAQGVRIAAGLAWIDLYFAKRKLKVLAELDKSIDDLSATVGARLTSGSARPSDAIRPAQLKADVADRRAAIEADIAKALTTLVRFTGDPSPDTSGPVPEQLIDHHALAADLESLPSLRRLDAATGLAEADVRLARADKRPDWSVGVSYGKRAPRFGDLLSVGVTIDLPIFASRRQDPVIAARAREVDRARLEREAALRELKAQLETDLAEHAKHYAQYARAKDTIVPLAEQRAKLDLASYEAGQLNLGLALTSTIDAAEAELNLFDREAETVRGAVMIKLTYGSEQQ